jgi:lipoprotein-anchoring transpeptidase ErfK/SrfK
MKNTITRRRFLATAAAVSVSGSAFAQAFPPQQAPQNQPYPRYPGDAQRPPMNIDPRAPQGPGPDQPPQGPQGPGGPQGPAAAQGPASPAELSALREKWYSRESIPDPQFPIRKVHQDLLNPEFRRQLVPYQHSEQPGTLVVDAKQYFLYLLREGGQAIRYGVGVGREGFGWSGKATIGRVAEWPAWVPPKEMRLRQPELPERVEGGPENPLGARALYLYEGNRDTLYRIHGTAEPWTIGTSVSSGCIRLLNEEIADLYLRTPVGTRVVVI